MTRSQFTARAIRNAERDLGVPPGWWGTWRDVTDGAVRVSVYARSGWKITLRGKRISTHDSRSFAITKARKLRRAR